MRSPQRGIVGCAVLLGCCLAVAGCGGSSNDTAGSSSFASSSASPSPQPSPTSAATLTPTPTSGAAAGHTEAVRCHTSGLAIGSRALGAAAGNHYAAIVFTNDSGQSCRVYGFPGMQLLNGSGKPIVTHVVRDPSSTPKLITLPAGAKAWTQVSWSAVPGDDEPNSEHCEPTPASTEVTPPDETAYKIIKWPYGPACEHGHIVVTALAAGAGPSHG